MDIYEEYAHGIASAAIKAVLYEAVAAPKPGLVDRFGQGAHRDMDIFTFMSSGSSIYKGMYSCAYAGLTGHEDGPALLHKIRPLGIACERDMMRATNGVNTHKGIIFSMGIVCAATGALYRHGYKEGIKAEEICSMAADMCRGLVEKELGNVSSKQNLTHGERLYMEYGITGIRGEVQGGFRTVLEKGMPILRNNELRERLNLNDLLLHTLMNIMTICNDTNVVIRGGLAGLQLVQDSAKEFMASGGMLSESGRDRLYEMDRLLVEKNLSPGGAADLLSLSLFLAAMEGIRL